MPTDTPEALSAYPICVRIPIAWGDMDAFQHVNNTVFFRYFETARINYFSAVGTLAPMESTGVGPILAETSCRFRRPLTFPDTVIAAVRVPLESLEEDRYTMEHVLWSEAQQTIAAMGTGSIVSFDYRNERRAPVPEVVRAAMVALESD
ncbi:MAG: acyl-CoA thioesterase [Deltaproteobacteria bacterium]|nr:acyl-CoA thioesterase [Deltaproteobacteria bacterium]